MVFEHLNLSAFGFEDLSIHFPTSFVRFIEAGKKHFLDIGNESQILFRLLIFQRALQNIVPIRNSGFAKEPL